MSYRMTVYMDQRDVTPWIQSVRVRIDDSVHRSFELRFAAWHSFDETNRWDIFESLDDNNPRQELLIRAGIIPPDRQRYIKLASERVPYLVATGYDWAWIAKRKTPRKTIILVPTSTSVESDVARAIADFEKRNPRTPIGTYRVWAGTRTIGQAVTRLLAAAGLRCSYRLPDFEMVPTVVDPTLSYWRAVEQLTDPWAPVRFYQRSTNTLVIDEPQQVKMSAGTALSIPASAIGELTAIPRPRATAERVILRFPSWR